jgi:AcrR family transcriptional regulator
MQDVADAAGVSKGLIHYHFHDKETLLTRLIEWMTQESIDREAATLALSAPKTAVDDLWTWVPARSNGATFACSTSSPRNAAHDQRRDPPVARGRREAAMVPVDRLFALLELRPRVPVQLLADVIVAFIDGLAIHASLGP